MPGSSSQRSKTAPANPPPPVRWRVWNLVDHPGWAMGWLLFLAAVWALVVWVTGRGYLGWLAFGILLLASWRLWLPIRYELTAEGIQQTIWGLRWQIPWKAVGRYELVDSGVWLFPRNPAGGGQPTRGMYLPWAGRREELLNHLRYHLEPRSPS